MGEEENGASVWKYPLVLSEAKAKWKLIHHGSRMEASLESHLAFRLGSGSVPLTGNLNRGARRASRQGAQLSSSLGNVCHCRPPIGPRFGKVSTGEFPHTGRHFVDAIMPCSRKGQSGQDRQPARGENKRKRKYKAALMSQPRGCCRACFAMGVVRGRDGGWCLAEKLLGSERKQSRLQACAPHPSGLQHTPTCR